MFRFAKVTLVAGVLVTLIICTGHIENTKDSCSYDYFLHPAISISETTGGYGPAANQ